MKKLFVFFILLFSASMAFADSSNSSSLLTPDAISKYTDMSVYYLSQIFGTVEGVLTNSASQMLGRVFYIMNLGILVISGIIVGYAVLISTIRLASEGVTIAPGKSTLFALLKISVGVALIFPSASTGYSILQNIVMQVVVKGVGLADSVWSAGLDYLNKGGVVWAKPMESGHASNPYLKILSGTNIDGLLGNDSLAAKVFQSEVCMLGSRDSHTSSAQNNNDTNSIAADSSATPYYNVQTRESLQRYDFPGLNDSSMLVDHPSCGSVSWNINGACDDANSSACSIARDAVGKLVFSMMPAAQGYYCYKNGATGSCQNVSMFNNLAKGISPYLVDTLVNYYPAIQVYSDMKQKNTDDSKKDFIDQAKREGWLMAGRYYWNIMQFAQIQESSSELTSYAPAAAATGPSAKSPDSNFQGIIDDATKDMSDVVGSTSDGRSAPFNDALKSVLGESGAETFVSVKYVGSNEKKGDDHPSGIINSKSMSAVGVPTTVLSPGVGMTFLTMFKKINDISHLFENWQDYKYNPIVFLHHLGKACIDITWYIWIIGSVQIAATVAVRSICTMMSPLGFAASAMSEWAKPLFMAIATMFWMVGFFLSYFVPLYPFMIFLFAALGWFISVIEAMVAAPLVALGLTHPESHDFLGKSEQAVMLLLSVFIQPTLLVIGLIAGIIVSYVSFELLIYAFSGFVLDIFHGTTGSGSTTNILAAAKASSLYDGANALVQPMLLVIFSIITYTLLTQSFSLIHLLRDNVMKWIGAPSTGLQSPEQMVHDVKGGLMSAGNQTGQALSSGFNAAESTINKGFSEMEQGQKDKKEAATLKGEEVSSSVDIEAV